MPCLKTIAIVGGGPAGAFAAAELARAGRNVFLFDEKLAWEKPCGGGLTHKAILRWPFLGDAQVERKWIHHCELIAPSGRKAFFQLEHPVAIFSRKTLNGLLLERARQAGAVILNQRIVQAERSANGWTLSSASESYDAGFVVLATGARNSLRSYFSRPLGPENFMVAAGYYVPGVRSAIQIKFVQGLHGYLWIFPRAHHCSAGICGRMLGRSTAGMRKLLEDWLRQLGIGLSGAQFYAHLIPSLTSESLRCAPFCGDGWAMIGDTAGFVDAVTGEGIFYALRSAELLSQALLAESPQSYPTTVKHDFLPELGLASRIADRFYAGDWMGKNVTEQIVQLTARSEHFRHLMRDLVSGAQEYSDLRQRLYRSLPAIAGEALAASICDGGAQIAGNGQDRWVGAGNRT